MLCLFVQLSRQYATDRYLMRYQGAVAKGLRTAGAGAQLFRQFRPVRRFRPDLRGGQTEPKNRRNPDPLQGADLRRDPDFAFSRRLAAVEDGMVRLSQTEGDLNFTAPSGSKHRCVRSDQHQQLGGKSPDAYLPGNRPKHRSLKRSDARDLGPDRYACIGK